MRWLMRQLEINSSGAFHFSQGFDYVYLKRPDFSADVIMTSKAREYITLHAVGGIVTFMFHTHAWCGSVIITVNGISRSVSLYESEHGYRNIEIEVDGKTEIQIETGAAPQPEARGTQVWLVAVEFSVPQDWMTRSMPITSWCTMTRGVHGTFLTLTNDAVIGTDIVNMGVWAQNDVDLFKTIIVPNMTVLDIGANIGHHTVVYSKLVGNVGRVISFEPQSVIFRLLAANTVINGCNNVELFQTCVGETSGLVNLFPVDYSTQTNFGALGVAPDSDRWANDSGEQCRIEQLDILLSELRQPLKSCDFIKIDVQSFELFVLRGAVNTLKKFRPTLFLEVSPFPMSRYYDYKHIYNFLFSLNYDVFHISDPTFGLNQIKEWDGQDRSEWDILARPRERLT